MSLKRTKSKNLTHYIILRMKPEESGFVILNAVKNLLETGIKSFASLRMTMVTFSMTTAALSMTPILMRYIWIKGLQRLY